MFWRDEIEYFKESVRPDKGRVSALRNVSLSALSKLTNSINDRFANTYYNFVGIERRPNLERFVEFVAICRIISWEVIANSTRIILSVEQLSIETLSLLKSFNFCKIY